MTKKITALLLTFGLAATTALQAVEVGTPAPGFTLTDSNGKSHSLSEYKGKYVVLEWVNFDCPFVKKQYGSGNMQKLQKEYTGKGVVWLSICSSAPGNQGNFKGDALKARMKEDDYSGTAYLIDESGTVGHLYGAKTTPHMFIINPEGTLIYAGGIDSIKSPNPADIAKAQNYVSSALDEAMAGKPVTTPSSAPYGCGVKYAN